MLAPLLLSSPAGGTNVLLIVADDLGWGDLGCYGSEHIRTPHLDALAEDGLRFTAAYAAAPVCSPSRAGLLTGRTPYRVGVFDWIPPEHPMRLPASEVTLAELLKGAGYATSFFGKWHLDGEFPVRGPRDHGFDYAFAHAGNTHHLDPEGFFRNGAAVETSGYSCRVVADDAIRWLKARDAERPFFQLVAFHEPHEIVESPPELVENYPEYTGTEPLYYANVEHLDQAVGDLLEALDELELARDTLVIFTSDHGPAEFEPGYRGRSHGSAGPFRGKKWTLWEGGLRVPFVVRWPGQVEPGVIEEPVGSIDLLPTIAEICGVDPPERVALDGSDVSKLLRGGELEREKPLHWHYYGPWSGPQSVLRDGDWVVTTDWTFRKEGRGRIGPGDLEGIPGAELTDALRLYDVVRDPHQDTDLAAKEPERLERLGALLRAAHEDVWEDLRAWPDPYSRDRR
ncbi:MAG: sulfatase-like hydrolase/transferase [bacterium]|nr:sulfatase-like hydrolase/transferase [bacterium]